MPVAEPYEWPVDPLRTHWPVRVRLVRPGDRYPADGTVPIEVAMLWALACP